MALITLPTLQQIFKIQEKEKIFYSKAYVLFVKNFVAMETTQRHYEKSEFAKDSVGFNTLLHEVGNSLLPFLYDPQPQPKDPRHKDIYCFGEVFAVEVFSAHTTVAGWKSFQEWIEDCEKLGCKFLPR
jgi:hypothetical protein